MGGTGCGTGGWRRSPSPERVRTIWLGGGSWAVKERGEELWARRGFAPPEEEEDPGGGGAVLPPLRSGRPR